MATFYSLKEIAIGCLYIRQPLKYPRRMFVSSEGRCLFMLWENPLFQNPFRGR